MSGPTTVTRVDYSDLDSDTRYEVLDADLSPSDVPDFQANHTGAQGHVNAHECVAAMREWLDTRINAGESRSSYNNESYQTISTRPNIKHWEYSKAPVLPRPQTIDPDGAACVNISLKGTVDPETRYTDPEPKNETYRHLWNIVALFAHETNGEIRFSYSQNPRDDLQAYVFYNFH